MTKKLILSLALCLSLLGTASPALAQVDNSGDDTLAQLQREGWKIVKDGVLQRELVPGEVESFVFGVPGFTWKIQDLKRQLQKLQAELRANPTPELRKAIANHRKAIANSQRALALARVSEESGEEIDLSKVSCTINFSYDATAARKADAQGVFASSSATFGATHLRRLLRPGLCLCLRQSLRQRGRDDRDRDGRPPGRGQRQRERVRQPQRWRPL